MKKKNKNYLIPPKKSSDVPATIGMLKEMRQELLSKVEPLESKIDFMQTHLQKIESRVNKNASNYFRALTDSEEQNSRNQFVVDGYFHLYDNQQEILGLIKNKGE